MSRSDQPGHDVNYLFGQMANDTAFVDCSGNCGNLNSAVGVANIDMNCRTMSMSKLHHAMMGTAAAAIASVTPIPGTLVNVAAGGSKRKSVTFGHPSDTLKVGAAASESNGAWSIEKVMMCRSARVLMEGFVGILG